MTRHLLDTNIVSNVIKPEPAPALAAWMADQADGDLFIASLTLAEIWRGILLLPAGRKRQALEKWAHGPDGPSATFAGRILPFDEAAALGWAQLMAEGRAAGRPRASADMIVAAVARSNDCVIVTDNEKDFWGLEVFNPMRA